MCEEPPEIPDFSKEKNELFENIKQLEDSLITLKSDRDSLLKVIPKVRTVIVERQRQIDENIAKDSSKAVVEYRKAMVENDYLPQGGEALSFYEIGIGAKLMAKVPKMELQIKTYEEIVQNDSLIFKDYDKTIEAHKSLNDIQNLEIRKWRQAYQDESAWYNSRALWLSIGVVGTVAIIFVSGLAK
jgi:hypothetical protein